MAGFGCGGNTKVEAGQEQASLLAKYLSDDCNFNPGECGSAGLEIKACKGLERVCNKDTAIKKDAYKELADLGIPKETLDILAGKDGNELLRKKVEFFSDRGIKRWWREDVNNISRDRYLRRLGIVGYLAPDKAVPALFDALDDDYVAKTAVLSLGKIAGMVPERRGEIIERLKKVYDNIGPDTSKGYLLEDLEDSIVEALGCTKDKSAVAIIRGAASNVGGRLIAGALGQLAKDGVEEAKVALTELLKGDYRNSALLQFNRFTYKPAVPILVDILENDPEESTRIDAAEALGNMKAAAAIEPLKKAALRGEYQSTFSLGNQALEALAKIGTRDAVTAIEEVVISDVKEAHSHALEALGSVKNMDLKIAGLIFAMGNSDLNISEGAAIKIKKIAEEKREYRDKILTALGSGLNSPSEFIRASTALVVGELKDACRFERLVEMMQSDPSLNARSYAASALGRLGNKNAVPILSKAALNRKTTVAVRMSAIRALGLLGNRDAVSTLKNVIFNDPIDIVREEAVASLGRLGEAEVVPILIDALEDKNIGYQAAQALSRMDPETVLPLLAGELKADRLPEGTREKALMIFSVHREKAESIIESMREKTGFSSKDLEAGRRFIFEMARFR